MPLTNLKRVALSPQVLASMKVTGPMQRLPAATPAPAPAPMPQFAQPPALPPAPSTPSRAALSTLKVPMAPINLPSQAPTPAALAMPSTPAQQAIAAADPSSSPSTMAMTLPKMTPTVQALANAPVPQTVSDALSVIAASAPSQLAASTAASPSSSPLLRRSGSQMARGGTINAPSQKYANAPSNASVHQPSQRRAAQGSTSMSKSFTRLERRIYCPIVSASIATTASGTVTTRPQVNFQPDQLIVSPGVAGFFDITQFTVGIQPQQAASGLAPGDAFPAQNGPHFLFDACDTGTDIIFGVTNNDTVAHVFKAVLVGYQIEITG